MLGVRASVQHDQQGAFSAQIAHQQIEEAVDHKSLTRYSQHNAKAKGIISHAGKNKEREELRTTSIDWRGIVIKKMPRHTY